MPSAKYMIDYARQNIGSVDPLPAHLLIKERGLGTRLPGDGAMSYDYFRLGAITQHNSMKATDGSTKQYGSRSCVRELCNVDCESLHKPIPVTDCHRCDGGTAHYWTVITHNSLVLYLSPQYSGKGSHTGHHPRV